MGEVRDDFGALAERGGGDSPNRGWRLSDYWAFVILVGAVVWASWATLERLLTRWSQDAQYTHGYVVPVLAFIVLWFRREAYPAGKAAPSWLGAPLMLVGAGLRLVGSLYAFDWLEAGSLVPTLGGAICAALGPAVLRWAWPVAALLVFALPWPWQLDLLITYPLRRLATVASTFALQALGVPALDRGNIIVINDLEVGVVEACSGLGMLMTFFALSTAVAFVIDRPPLDRAVIFLSAAPVGVLMNVVRITLTVYLYETAGAEVGQAVFHDVAGWVMMPLALATLWVELHFLGRLWLPAEATGPVPVASRAAPTPLCPAPAISPPDMADPPAGRMAMQEICDAPP